MHRCALIRVAHLYPSFHVNPDSRLGRQGELGKFRGGRSPHLIAGPDRGELFGRIVGRHDATPLIRKIRLRGGLNRTFEDHRQPELETRAGD
jgi:hypothetical protein